MEDLRLPDNKPTRKINYRKIILIGFVLFVIFYPNLIGGFIGWWIKSFIGAIGL